MTEHVVEMVQYSEMLDVFVVCLILVDDGENIGEIKE